MESSVFPDELSRSPGEPTADADDSETLLVDSSRLYLSAIPASPPPLSPLPVALISSTHLIPNSRFLVDAFAHSGSHSRSYFLSHFHSDHFGPICSSWRDGIIFSSQTTSVLLSTILCIPPSFLHPLPLSRPISIDRWIVTLIDANHCPGAVQLLFQSPDGSCRYIHTGDFRFAEWMKSDPHLLRFVGCDAVFLDTTYCNPKYLFPPQETSVDYIVCKVKQIREDHQNVLVLIATYVVGKEKILLEVARRCGCLVHADRKKMKILSVLGYGDSGFFTEDASATNVHVIGWNLLGETWPYFRPNFTKMREMMEERGYSKAVGFVPTGWMHETKREGFAVRTKDSLEIHLVPYSEHSSYEELREYVRFLRPKRVIPTVGVDVNNTHSKASIALQKHFSGLLDEMANKHKFLMPFHKKSTGAAPNDKVEICCGTGDRQLLDKAAESLHFVPLCAPSDPGGEDTVCSDYKGLDEAKEELRELLPSWVTEDQLLHLLAVSDGDTMAAVSEFFEQEREIFEWANVHKPSHPGSPEQTLAEELQPTQKGCRIGLPMSKNHVTASVNVKLLSVKPSPLKKRATGNRSNPRKKSKTVPTVELGGGKQVMITKFFGRVVDDASETKKCCTSDANRQSNSAYTNMEVDLFLQIVNGGVVRETAISFLEKAKGDISVAVDMFYGGSNNVNIASMDLSASQVIGSDTKTGPINSQEGGNSSDLNSDLPNPSANSVDVGEVSSNVSFPIEKYLPSHHACWEVGEPAPYLHLARTFELVEREKGKIKTTAMLCNMFRSLLALSPDDVLPAVYLCTNKIAPDHENMELNIGGSLVISALEDALGTSRSRIKEMYKTYGDLGDVAQECRQHQRLLAPPHPLLIRDLFRILKKISSATGSGSVQQRKIFVVHLLRACREMEIKFLVRTLVRNLRIGATIRTILPALAQAVIINCSHSSEHAVLLEELKTKMEDVSNEFLLAYNVLPDLGLLVPSLLTKGVSFLASDIPLVPGAPIPPMLARITNGFVQALKIFQSRAFSCEYKYDGQRAQIHKLADGSIRIFSRQMKESTSRFPDLVSIINEVCNPAASSFILDAEVVAVNRKKGNKLMSFQELCSRERGGKESSISIHSIKVDVCLFVFDAMFYNNERLLESTLRERRKYLHQIFKEKSGYLEIAKGITVERDDASPESSDTLNKMRSFFEEACDSSCEGIMVKSLDVDALYSSYRRSESWLKVKRDYVGLGDTLDLVPIGAWHGNGRKAGWYSPFLMACYEPDMEEFQSVCRVMSGFSDEFYKEMKLYFADKVLPKKPSYYQTNESPELWFPPEVVWEIRGADLSVSPVHHGAIGLVHPSRGISMRLPRFVRLLPDRNADDCSSAADVACMFKSQTRKMDVCDKD